MKKILSFFVAFFVGATALAGPFASSSGGPNSVNGQAITPSSVSTGAITATSIVSPGIRVKLTTDKTLYVRTPAAAVTFSSGSANIGWPSHGLSVNDPVVLSVLPNMGVTTVTIASPGVFSKTAHGYVAGQPLRFDTTGALPTGLTAGTTYYVIAAGLTANAFQVSASVGGAAVNTSGSQSGTHYVSQVGAMPTFSTAGLLVAGTAYYVKTVPSANSITLSLTPSGTALGTATLATGTPIYSASTGSDSNDCSAADRAHACLTAQKVQTVLESTLDFNGDPSVHVTLQHADSAYPEAVVRGGIVGAAGLNYDNFNGAFYTPPVLIRGNPSAPSNVIFQTPSGSDLPIAAVTGASAIYGVDGVTFDTTLGQDFVDAVDIVGGGNLMLGTVVMRSTGNNLGFYVGYGGVLGYLGNSVGNTMTLIGPYWIVVSNVQGSVRWVFDSTTLLETTLGHAFYSSPGPSVGEFQTSFVGSATGTRFILSEGATLNTGGGSGSLSYLPGSTAGTVEGGVSYNANIGATSTNDSALVGMRGEYGSVCVASGAAITLSNGTTANVGTVTLTIGGDYDFEGNVNFAGTTATVTGGQAAISTTSATLPTDGSELYDGTVTTALSDNSTVTLPRKRVSLAAGASVFFVANKSFSAGSVKAFGCLNWRRPR